MNFISAYSHQSHIFEYKFIEIAFDKIFRGLLISIYE